MNKYNVIVDIPQDEDWNDIEVETMEVEAETANEARDKAVDEVHAKHEEYYVWEVLECDKIED